MILLNVIASSHHMIKAACEELKACYPGLTRGAIVARVPIPGPVKWVDDRFFKGQLGAYAMCLNHWLPFLPVPVVLINAGWLDDYDQLKSRYEYDTATNFHPDCGCPVRYIVCHEFAHFIYVNMGKGRQEQWKQDYEHARPSGYSYNPEESFCEAFAGHIAGLTGKYYDDAPRFAADYSNL